MEFISRKILQEYPPPPAQFITGERKAARLDTSVVIILGAVLCLLICAVWVHSVVRCMIRRNRQVSITTVAADVARDPPAESNVGLDPKTIADLPVVRVCVTEGESHVSEVDQQVALTGNTECIVCLQEFVDGEPIKLLPNCGHGFHAECISVWLMAHSSCPICRHGVLEPPSPGDFSGELSGSFTANSRTLLLSSPVMRDLQQQLNNQRRRELLGEVRSSEARAATVLHFIHARAGNSRAVASATLV